LITEAYFNSKKEKPLSFELGKAIGSLDHGRSGRIAQGIVPPLRRDVHGRENGKFLSPKIRYSLRI